MTQTKLSKSEIIYLCTSLVYNLKYDDQLKNVAPKYLNGVMSEQIQNLSLSEIQDIINDHFMSAIV